jgi:hypothetical protein
LAGDKKRILPFEAANRMSLLLLPSPFFTIFIFSKSTFTDGKERKIDFILCTTIEILGATYTRRSMFEKRENFFSADLNPVL